MIQNISKLFKELIRIEIERKFPRGGESDLIRLVDPF